MSVHCKPPIQKPGSIPNKIASAALNKPSLVMPAAYAPGKRWMNKRDKLFELLSGDACGRGLLYEGLYFSETREGWEVWLAEWTSRMGGLGMVWYLRWDM